MGKVEQVTVGLPIEALDAVRKAVEAGDYASEADALSAAVRTWRDARESIGLADEDLGALWDAGAASGSGRFGSFEDLIAEAEWRFQSGSGKSPE
jgi:antitoxin ParD1/3/4